MFKNYGKYYSTYFFMFFGWTFLNGMELVEVKPSLEETKVANVFNDVQSGDLDQLKIAINNGFDPEQHSDSTGETLLTLSVKAGHEEIVKYLVEELKVRINQRNKQGYSPFMTAVIKNRIALVKYLDQRGADVDLGNESFTPLMHALEKNYNEIVEYLVEERRVNVNKADAQGVTPLMIAAEKGSWYFFQYLLKHGADAYGNVKNELDLLEYAYQGGNIKILQYLVELEGHKVPFPYDVQALFQAVYYANQAMVDWLFTEKNVDINYPNKSGLTPVFFAILRNNKDPYYDLVSKGANVHVKDDRGQTPLFYAVHVGNEEIVKDLVENQHINIYSTNIDGLTACMCAKKTNKESIYEYLLKQESKELVIIKDVFAYLQSGDLDQLKIAINNGFDPEKYSEPTGETLLTLSVKAGHEEIVTYLVEELKVRINQRNKQGYSPFMTAVMENKIALVKYLDQRGADVDLGNESFTPLMHALEKNYNEIVEYLVEERRVNVNKANAQGVTPLMIAVKKGSWYFFQYLLKHGADAYGNVKNELDLLEYAYQGGNIKILQYLVELEGHNTPLPYEVQSLFKAVRYSNQAMVDWLFIEKNVDINHANDVGMTALLEAITLNKKDIYYDLVSKGANVHVQDDQGQTPLLYAIHVGDEEIVKDLVEIRKVNVNKGDIQGITPLMRAVVKRSLYLCEYLLKNGADVNQEDINGDWSIMDAIKKNYVDVYSLLVNHGANVHKRNKIARKTPLQLAVEFDCKEIIKDLIENQKVDLNKRDQDGDTLLNNAIRSNQVDFAKYLIGQGAKIDYKNRIGYEALLVAVKNQRWDIGEFLVKTLKADVNVRSNLGGTPLMLAVYNNNFNFVVLLTQYGANINAETDNRDDSALSIALKMKNPAIINFLLKSGADKNLLDEQNQQNLSKLLKIQYRLKYSLNN